MVEIGAFAGAFGARERSFEEIDGLAELMIQHNIPLSLAMMGCRTFAQADEPPEILVAEAIRASLAAGSVPASAVSHVFLATSDNHLHQLGDSFAQSLLQSAGLDHALPVLVSFQKCASSILALDLVCSALAARGGGTALVVGFDVLGQDDGERVKSFALFGDGAACCVVSTEYRLDFRFDGCGVTTDPAGMFGQDTFDSRKAAALESLNRALAASGAELADIAACFSTNLFKPVSMFNASICGLPASRLSLTTGAQRGHCGNADWMINLAAFAEAGKIERGGRYLAQAFAPGFCACAILTARSGD
jgi:3-oxoacyl-[acyl-carrier-protein] synthase-3